MRDHLAWLYARENLPVADPARYFDYAEKRLKQRLARLKAREALAELMKSGITFSVRQGVLYAGPADRIINGTAKRIEEMRTWFVEILQESAT